MISLDLFLEFFGHDFFSLSVCFLNCQCFRNRVLFIFQFNFEHMFIHSSLFYLYLLFSLNLLILSISFTYSVACLCSITTFLICFFSLDILWCIFSFVVYSCFYFCALSILPFGIALFYQFLSYVLFFFFSFFYLIFI